MKLTTAESGEANIFLTRFPLKIVCNKKMLIHIAFHFVLDYAITRVQVNQDDLKFNGTHQLWFMLMMLICWAEAYVL